MRRTGLGAWSVLGMVSSLAACSSGSGEMDARATSSGAAAGGAGGSGGSGTESLPVCEPGAIEACYSGPGATKGVGACKAGSRTCNDEGSAWSACAGEVVPAAAEDCATAVDDDCNGTALEASAGCVCIPEQTTACYSGPPGTEGVGVCKAGVAACGADGKAWGACDGERLPLPEDCAMFGDEDCDGVGCSDNAWSVATGNDVYVGITSVAADAQGNVYAAGYFEGTLDFGGGVSTSTGHDAFVVKLDASGQHAWTQTFGSGGYQRIVSISVDVDGVYVAGAFSESIFGTLVQSPSVEPSFVAKLDASSGQPVWAQKLELGQFTMAYDLAVDGAGHLVVVGDLDNQVQGDDAFVMTLNTSNGTPTWAKPKVAGGPGEQRARAVAFDSAGNIHVTGMFASALDFGLPVSTSSFADVDAFVVKLNADGDHVWTYHHLPAPSGVQVGYAIAVDGGGAVYALGIFDGPVDFGGGLLTFPAYSDSYFLKLDPDGEHQYSAAFGSPPAGSASLASIAVAPDGNVVIAGSAYGSSVDVGSGPLPQFGATDALLAKLSGQGSHVWSKALGQPDWDAASAIAIAPNGTIVVGGGSENPGALDFGSGPVAMPAKKNAWIAAFAP